MNRRQVLIALVVVEVFIGLAAIRWRLSLPVVPEANLSRLPASTAREIQRLQSAARSGRQPEWLELGEALLAYGYFPQAEVCLRYASEKSPDDFRSVYAHAYSLDRLCRLPEAEAQFRAAARLTQGQRANNCWYHIGLGHLRRDNTVEAEQALIRARDYPPAVHTRARLMIRSGRAKEAQALIEILRKELKLDVQTEMLAVQVSRELGNSTELHKAEERAERSQQKLRLSDHWEYLHPIRARYGLMAEYSRAQELAGQGKLGPAVQVFQSMLQNEDPDQTDGFFEQGAYMLLLAGKSDEALNLLTRSSDRMGLSPAAMHLMGDARLAQNRPDEAVKAWETANRLRPDNHSLRSLSAIHARSGLGSPPQEQALAMVVEGISAYRANDLEAAKKNLEQAARVLTDDSQCWYYLGETHLALSQLDQARSAWRRCVEIDQDHGRALERLSQFPE